MFHRLRLLSGSCVLVGALAVLPGARARAADGFLATLHHHVTLGSTVPDNGDQNPYAIVVAPLSAGTVAKGDVLVDNFNNGGNLQGTGSTIVDYHPDTKAVSLFAQIPRDLPGCPGGVGLGTAMTMLKSGWVLVGSAPSTDGTMNTRGRGCLILLDAQGHVAATIAGPDIDMPWGNMASIDDGTTATLFVSNAGFGLGSPDGEPPVVHQATVLRIRLSILAGKPPAVVSQTVIGSGFGAQSDKGVFLIGPTGLALGPDGTLFVSDATENRIVAIEHAAERRDSAGTGRMVTAGGMLQRPLAMAMAPNGHLIVTNGLNGQVVEVDPASGTQIGAQWVDPDKAQSPPGSGDLFGIAMTPGGGGFYYVEDENNTLVLAR
ncbi:MAG: hypothetical protein HIU92_14685 [Proteobacteria bacterium]|nr:hypothetical protein [Pseudomonadota bacterium]